MKRKQNHGPPKPQFDVSHGARTVTAVLDGPDLLFCLCSYRGTQKPGSLPSQVTEWMSKHQFTSLPQHFKAKTIPTLPLSFFWVIFGSSQQTRAILKEEVAILFLQFKACLFNLDLNDLGNCWSWVGNGFVTLLTPLDSNQNLLDNKQSVERIGFKIWHWFLQWP